MKETALTITPEIINTIIPRDKIFPRVPNLGEIHQIESASNNLALGLHWVVKLDWSHKHKLPASRKAAQALKPLGQYLHQIFLLAAAVHARQQALPDPLRYSNAGEWFTLICKGKFDEIVGETLLPQPESKPIDSTYNGDEKRCRLRGLMENPRAVEQGENLLKSNPYLVALSDLIDAAIALSNESPQFKNQYLKPFTQAWRGALKEMESERWQRQFVKDGQLHQQRSKSKGTINLTAKKKREAEKLTTQALQSLPAKSQNGVPFREI